MSPSMRRSSRQWVLSFLWLPVFAFSALAQATEAGDSFQKTFKKFAGLVPGVDLFASDREAVTQFKMPLSEGISRLNTMLGDKLPSGALVICRTAAEKDSVAEERVLKMGYKWVLIQLSPQAEMEQMIEQLKTRMGGQLPPEVLARFQQRTPEQNAATAAGMIAGIIPRMSFAIVTALLAPDKEFKASRLDDLSRSPMADWIDLGLSRYAANTSATAIRWTQEHLEEAFPLEDLLQMNRPFVPPDMAGGMMGGGMPGGFRIVMGGPAGGGGAAATPGPPQASGGERGTGGGGGMQVRGQMPKEVQDRLNFDNQAILFFAYLVEKVGLEKTRQLVQLNREGKDLVEALKQLEFLGKPVEEIETDWIEWIMAQKAPMPQTFRVTTGPPENPPAKPPF